MQDEMRLMTSHLKVATIIKRIMLRQLLNRLTENLPVRDIRVHGHKYLERYYVGTCFGYQVYIHRFLASDPDEEVHDHPWDAWTMILAGYYREETMFDDILRIRRAFRPAKIGRHKFHRVHFPSELQDTWTLFIHGKRVKGWGFWDKAAQSYRPFALTAEDNLHTDWWHTAPTGKQLREQENDRHAQTSKPTEVRPIN